MEHFKDIKFLIRLAKSAHDWNTVRNLGFELAAKKRSLRQKESLKGPPRNTQEQAPHHSS